jgi:hypothetical protein
MLQKVVVIKVKDLFLLAVVRLCLFMGKFKNRHLNSTLKLKNGP